jgi:hypothetical protein
MHPSMQKYHKAKEDDKFYVNNTLITCISSKKRRSIKLFRFETVTEEMSKIRYNNRWIEYDKHKNLLYNKGCGTLWVFNKKTKRLYTIYKPNFGHGPKKFAEIYIKIIIYETGEQVNKFAQLIADEAMKIVGPWPELLNATGEEINQIIHLFRKNRWIPKEELYEKSRKLTEEWY